MSNPVFSYLFEQYKQLAAQGLDRTEEARHIFGEMMACAPDEYLEVARSIAVEMVLMPEQPDGYSDTGDSNEIEMKMPIEEFFHMAVSIVESGRFREVPVGSVFYLIYLALGWFWAIVAMGWTYWFLNRKSAD